MMASGATTTESTIAILTWVLYRGDRVQTVTPPGRYLEVLIRIAAPFPRIRDSVHLP